MVLKIDIVHLGLVGILIISNLFFLSQCAINNTRVVEDSDTYLQINKTEIKPLNSHSCEEWVRTWGQINEDELLEGMAVYNKTGDVYLIGWNQTYYDDNNDDILLVKYNRSGVLEWSITLDGDGVLNDQDIGEDLVIDQDSGEIYILATIFNKTNQDLFIAKYLSNGKQVWNTTWGNNTIEYAEGISFDPEGGFIYVAGTIYDFPNNKKIVLVKIDITTGDQIWNTTWSENSDAFADDVACSSSGDIYVTGSKEKTANDKDMLLIKYDENKVQKWNLTWGDSSYNESGNAVKVDTRGDIYVTGTKEIESTFDSLMFLTRYNSSGYPNWTIIYFGFFNCVEGKDLYLDADDNIYVAIAGYGSLSGNSLILQKYNRKGDKLLEVNWNGVDNFIWTEAISGYNATIYIAGILLIDSSWKNDFILVKNPLICAPTNGGSSDDDDDDDDNGSKIPGYDYFLIIGIFCVISTLIIIDFKRKKI